MITLKVGNYNNAQVMKLREVLEEANYNLCQQSGTPYCETCKVRVVCKDIARALSHLDDVVSENLS